MYKRIFPILLSLFLAVPLHAQFTMSGYSITVNAPSTKTGQVDILKGERWWAISPEGFAMDLKEHPDASRPFHTNMLVSSMGRYIWCRETMTVTNDTDDRMIVGGELAVPEVKKAGKTLREAYLYCCHANFKPAGTIPDAALFSHPVYRPGGRFSGEERIVSYAERIIAEGLPKGTIVIPDLWFSIHKPFKFDAEIYPDPQRMINKLHELGFRVMLTVSPYLPPHGLAFYTAAENEQVMPTNMDAAVYRMAEADVAQYFSDEVEALKRQYGFDGYFYNFMPTYSDEPVHIFEGFMNNWAVLGLPGDIVTGVYLAPLAPYATDTGLAEPTSSEELLRNLLSASLSGVLGQLVSWGSFSEMNIEANMARYSLLAACMPVATVDSAPWEFSDRNLQGQVKNALLFRESIAGYMEKLIEESAKTAEPVIRHLEYQFPRQGFSDCDDQFMLGPKYLIAPCMDGEERRMVRLPKGRWKDRDGKQFKGPLVTEADCSQGLIYFEHI